MAAPPATNGLTTTVMLKPRVVDLLPGKAADIARALGRKPSDGTVRRTLEALATEGFAERIDGVWRRCQQEPDGASDPDDPAIPDGFDQESSSLFLRTREQLVAQDTWKDSDLPLLKRYIQALQDERVYRRQAVDDGEFSKAKTGRVFVHPAVPLANAREKAANEMASALLLTPESRRRAGRLAKEDGGQDPLDGF